MRGNKTAFPLIIDLKDLKDYVDILLIMWTALTFMMRDYRKKYLVRQLCLGSL